MRLLVALSFLIPLLSGCETIEKGIRDITGQPEPKAPVVARKPEPPRQPEAPVAARKPEPARSAESLLAAGVAQYEEGNYTQAQRTIQLSLAEGLPSGASQARAYKYLAFIYCVTDRTPQCRQQFSNALAADPKFTLTAAEAGHPTWGPVFRSVKQGR